MLGDYDYNVLKLRGEEMLGDYVEQTAEFFWGADAGLEAKTLLEIVSKAQDALSEDAVF